jgi:hypothetical protein
MGSTRDLLMEREVSRCELLRPNAHSWRSAIKDQIGEKAARACKSVSKDRTQYNNTDRSQ